MMKRFVPSSKVELDAYAVKNLRKYQFELKVFDAVTCTNEANVVEISELCLEKKICLSKILEIQ